MNAQESLDQFVQQNGGKIPRTEPNLTTTGSDIAFVFTSNYLAVLDWWHATKDQRCIDMLVDATDWLFTQTDEHIKDIEFDVTDWTNGKRVQKRRLSDHGYSHSPRSSWSPGWCRWIYVEGKTLGNRPEVLCDGFTGQAIAHFIKDCKNHIDQSKANEWLENLASIFDYHSSSFKVKHKHTPGKTFDTPHDGLAISAYYWPAGNDDSGTVYRTAVGMNQNSVFITMGLLVEDMLGRDIGAKKTANAFIDDTLPHYIIENGSDKIFHLYDLRDNPSEKSNDSFHAYKANIILTTAVNMGMISADYHRKIIKQVKDVCHKGNGRMSVLMHGSDDHGGGYNPNKHPSAGHWLECLLWEGGDTLLDIAQMTLKLEHDGKTDHKSNSFVARFHRAEALHSVDGESFTGGASLKLRSKPADMPMHDSTKEPAVTSPPQSGDKASEKQSTVETGANPCAACDTDSGKHVSVRVGEEAFVPGSRGYTGDFTFDDHGTAATVSNRWKKGVGDCLLVTGLTTGDTVLRFGSNEVRVSVK